MTLYESGDSTGEVSLSGLLQAKVKTGNVRKVELKEIARLIVRGGWPENIYLSEEDFGVMPESYIEALVTKDMREGRHKKRNPQKMRLLLCSLSQMNQLWHEVDAIIEFKGGDYAAFEIKLSDGSIDDALKSLATFY